MSSGVVHQTPRSPTTLASGVAYQTSRSLPSQESALGITLTNPSRSTLSELVAGQASSSNFNPN
eukprot:2022388-Prorocentrum_lima.AAC.1